MQMSKLDASPVPEPLCTSGCRKDKPQTGLEGPEEVFVAVVLLPSPALSLTAPQAVTDSAPPASLVSLRLETESCCTQQRGGGGRLWGAGQGVAALVWQLGEESCFQPAGLESCLRLHLNGEGAILLQMRICTDGGNLYCPNESACVKRTEMQPRGQGNQLALPVSSGTSAQAGHSSGLSF